MSRLCFRCDEPAGLEGLRPYEASGSVEHFHPSCVADMLAKGSCSGDADDDAEFATNLRPLSPGGSS